jgi:15-cis-phytoene synthase
MEDAFRHCERLVREADQDRFFATLFAPASHRAPLFALYAFNAEIAGVRERAREPLPGEIRLQWWREVFAGTREGEAAAHPVTFALLETVRRFRLPVSALSDLVEARSFDLYDEPMATIAELERYVSRTSATVLELAARILRDGIDPAIAELARHAGAAHAITSLLRLLAVHAVRRQLYVPLEVLRRHGVDPESVFSRTDTPQLHAALADMRELCRRHLAHARTLIAAAPREIGPALLPVALAEPMLRRTERASNPFDATEMPQWRRQWTLWRAARGNHVTI